MSKKREHSEFSKVIKKIFHSFLGGISEGITEWWDEKTESINRKARLLVYMLISILIGLVFISIGLVFLLAKYARINLAWSFLIIGGLIILNWLIIANITKKR